MKKFYSMVVLLIASILAFNASAKTVSISTNMDNAVYIICTWENSPYPIALTGESQELNWSDEPNSHGGYANLMINANSGYEITNVIVGGNQVFNGKSNNYSVAYESVNNGDAILVVADQEQEADAVKFMVVGNSEHFNVRYNYSEVSPTSTGANAMWEIEKNQYCPEITLEAKSGFAIRSITDDKGVEIPVNNPTYCSFYIGNYTENATFEVTSYDLAASRTAAATISVTDAEKYMINVRRHGGITVNESEFDNFKFDPENDLPLVIEHFYGSSSGYSIYKVQVNGEDARQEGHQWFVDQLNDGDEITVTVNYPKIEVPFKVNFVNEGTEGALKYFYVGGNSVAMSVLTSGDFKAYAGDTFSFQVDQASYNFNYIKVNGDEYNGSYYNGEVPEGGVIIEVDATPLTPYTFIVNCNNWEHLTIRSQEGELTLTGVTTVFEIERSNNNITFSPAENYFVSSAYCGDKEIPYGYISLSDYEIDGEIELDIVVEEYIRNKQLVVFVADSWSNKNIGLHNYAPYDLRKTIDLSKGYNFVDFSDEDLPLNFDFYAMTSDYSAIPSIIYFNGVVIENEYGQYPATAEVPDNSVFKVYQSTPEEHSVEIDLGEDSGAQIHADYVTPFDGAKMTVHHGTHIVITAAPQVALLAEGSEAKEVPFDVKVGDQILKADEEGKVVVPVTDDVKIQVGKAGTLSVDSILDETEAANGAVYNLQGVKVLENAADVNNLPAGLYIANGKKIVVK